jgi:hypothetical protein
MPRTKQSFSPAKVRRIQKFVQDYGYGATGAASKKFGISYFLVRQILGKIPKGHGTFTRPGKRAPTPAKVRKQAKALRDTIKSFRKLSRDFGKLGKVISRLT